MAAERAASNPLASGAGTRALEHAYGFGYSQTGGYMVDYINAIQPLVVASDGRPIYDGYIVGVAGGAFVGGVPLNQCAARAAGTTPAADPQRRRAGDPDHVPVGLPVRQRRPARGRRHDGRPVPPLRDGRAGHATPDELYYSAAPADIVRAGRDVPPTYVQRGPAQPVPELDPLRRGADEPRSVGARRAAAAAPSDPCRSARRLDEFGNVTGGLRSPFVDVPTSTWFGSATGASFCFIAGHEVPFDQATLDGSTRPRRVREAVTHDVARLVGQRS